MWLGYLIFATLAIRKTSPFYPELHWAFHTLDYLLMWVSRALGLRY